ncbi:dienelactone hydrolase family protein [Stigmatella aurantiaca]|uniref:Dienelactone hydrolase n=1 Tax=Stigmatella aurantiaca (strain DW4/3-1) TaxID=378806 RepID=Q08RN0_STIAD|nr:dienelactone hydrolase family protein [Stigmatella aurantiaca]ADO68783.1 Dienelactone hydrolase family protein [Stigmatella aurantiaca DW4/3-1]EAU63142.1 dienelactone hydrolase [Stigmatella aurantiaca DW4/3-1]
MAESTKWTAKDGTELPGYLSEAPGGNAPGAVLLVHEWWGLNGHIRGVADRLAKEGFTVFAVDLFQGKVAKDPSTAQQYMGALNWKQVEVDLHRAADALRQRRPGTKVGITGFCLGGGIALFAAAKDPEIAACVPFYGIPGDDKADVTKIRAAVLGHYANQDDFCAPDRVNALEKKLQGANVPVEIHRYAAQHAFFNDTRPEVYSPQNAETAWRRTVDFLHAKLG